jgi:hypothetical protein
MKLIDITVILSKNDGRSHESPSPRVVDAILDRANPSKPLSRQWSATSPDMDDVQSSIETLASTSLIGQFAANLTPGSSTATSRYEARDAHSVPSPRAADLAMIHLASIGRSQSFEIISQRSMPSVAEQAPWVSRIGWVRNPGVDSVPNRYGHDSTVQDEQEPAEIELRASQQGYHDGELDVELRPAKADRIEPADGDDPTVDVSSNSLPVDEQSATLIIALVATCGWYNTERRRDQDVRWARADKAR